MTPLWFIQHLLQKHLLGLALLICATLIGWLFLRTAPDDVQAPLPVMPMGSQQQSSTVKDDIIAIENIWRDILKQQNGISYQDITLIFYDGALQPPCDIGRTITVPFYCAKDQTLYAPAHEPPTPARDPPPSAFFTTQYRLAYGVAQHIQAQLGILDHVNQARRGLSPYDQAQLDLFLNLQADCMIGIWAQLARDQIGEIGAKQLTQTLMALERQHSKLGAEMMGNVPQRQRWFVRGYQSIALVHCNTFAYNQL